MSDGKLQRVIAYIDGFNLYYGLMESGFGKHRWLNLPALVEKLLFQGQELVLTKYFTSRITGGRPGDRKEYAEERDARRKRQVTYLEALQTLPKLRIYYGQYLDKEMKCTKCNARWVSAEEKMTDVSIATELIVDAYANRYDAAIIISGDSDLSPPINAIRTHLSHKRINIAFPPARFSTELLRSAHGQCKTTIHKGNLRRCQLPEEIRLPGGYILRRPEYWKQ